MGYADFSGSNDYFISLTAVVVGNLAASRTTLTGFRLWLAWLLATLIVAGVIVVCLSVFRRLE